MKIKLTQKLFNIQGQALKDENNNVIILKDALVNITLTDVNEEEDKLSNFKLAVKLQNANDEVDLEVEDVSKLQQKSRKVYNTLMVGQIYEILEGKVNPLNPKE